MRYILLLAVLVTMPVRSEVVIERHRVGDFCSRTPAYHMCMAVGKAAKFSTDTSNKMCLGQPMTEHNCMVDICPAVKKDPKLYERFGDLGCGCGQ